METIGVLEAKRAEIDVSSDVVCDQAAGYARSVPNCYQTWQNPLPFLFTSNGKDIYFQDFREKDADWKQLDKIYRPKDLVTMLGVDDPFAGLPTLRSKGLRACQYEAVTELEKSFRNGHKRALMVLATGAGKTYTACLTAYRMLNYTPMRRVLFLVDRNNLGKQAEGEFGSFRLTDNGDAFNTIFAVNRLRSAEIPTDSSVVISTIQRLFSLLKGEPILDDTDDDESDMDEEVVLPPNPNLPRDFFDLIIIDECHRSIYGNWRKVLEYFDTARLIGLTATPVPETMAFFNNNRVVNYTLEQSIIDGVNVDCRNRLRSAEIPTDSSVVISTIQRLFSLLKGEPILDDTDDDESDMDEEVVLPPNPNLPRDFFDLIIIDECHRSIYGNWRKVLEYFDTARLIGLTATPVPETMAFFNNNRVVNYTLEQSIIDGVNVDCRVYRIKTKVTEEGECHRSIYGNWRKVLEYFDTARLIGLTATPIPETMAFFNNNRVVNYTLEQSIIDGVNVDCRVYRIKTKVTEEGGAILKGKKTRVETKYTGTIKTISTKETKNYTREELNRSIINPAQIKLILSTYRDADRAIDWVDGNAYPRNNGLL